MYKLFAYHTYNVRMKLGRFCNEDIFSCVCECVVVDQRPLDVWEDLVSHSTYTENISVSCSIHSHKHGSPKILNIRRLSKDVYINSFPSYLKYTTYIHVRSYIIHLHVYL